MFKIIRTIGDITRTIQIDSNNHFKEFGLNNNLYIYIVRICEQPGMFLGELADNVQIDRTTAFRTIKKLVKLGYFELKKDSVNQKIKRVYPTEKAMDIYPQLHEYEQKQSDFLLSNLSTEEIAQLKQLMAKLKY
ncbi:MarR family transcriptional regulator [Streptococcus infantarius]|uniref:MarR family winged helix-turn-helix transcriptional regulator n=1 Tax=Streptococcus infantarius TaxID=102684 RepID=UPI00208FE2F7|nr:MarR family transcriptional regulator [Streptococcus infantarius]MBK8155141.1 winged helix DNA-binding protein [Streptococcus sp.]MCO4474081.1 transcriptional regulator, MarR family [Streptococcus infantarius subsp. infantarius]MCO4479144.1 transcriptional regulator, MarR family [Streptococcus infantarius subsp. infantarius]MCO4480548.1 transcriptional regulator, MarR family [Streptococcus infantarius subsp. infantarius]MCO4482514.1 transcriptional regulator, MarR family [Streptococcus infa